MNSILKSNFYIGIIKDLESHYDYSKKHMGLNDGQSLHYADEYVINRGSEHEEFVVSYIAFMRLAENHQHTLSYESEDELWIVDEFKWRYEKVRAVFDELEKKSPDLPFVKDLIFFRDMYNLGES
ncbi:hypothetical protein ACJJIU_01415 [Microbulbifer sp. CnH-101-E]|uniref:hypothetical protein n=1 Tax=unclassified Microbulbifer TaxID=2619833 RepID=UPI00403A68BD